MVFALKTTHKDRYLRFRFEEIQTYGLLQASAERVTDSYAQFEFLTSDSYFGHYHIRCRYNNKYLVRWSPNHYWLTATADKTNENKKDWMCTLFKRIDLNDRGALKFRLLHIQLGHYARVLMIGEPFDACLFAESRDADNTSLSDVFTFVDLNKIHTSSYTKRVAFKGDNGKYLGPFVKNGVPYLQFSYENPNDPKVMHEIFGLPHGIMHIKSHYTGKFWRSGNNNWILADCNDPRGGTYAASMFRSTPLGVNVVGFLNMESTWHIKRYTNFGLESCLNAANPNVDKCVRLEVIHLGGRDSIIAN